MAENNNNNSNYGFSIDMSSIINAGAQYMAAEKAAEAVKEATEEQIKWERERALNAHQWEVVDLQKAGLNPILSAGGQGATTGGISAPIPDTSGYGKAGEAIVNAVIKKKEIENQTAAVDAQVQNAIADTDLKKNQSNLAMAQIATEMEKAGLISKQQGTEIAEQTLKYAQANKIDNETKALRAKLQSEIQQLQANIELAKQNKEFTKAKQLEQEFNNKVRILNWLAEKVEQGARIAQGTANSAANVLNAVNPIKR